MNSIVQIIDSNLLGSRESDDMPGFFRYFYFNNFENQMPNLKLNYLMEFCVKAARDLTSWISCNTVKVGSLLKRSCTILTSFNTTSADIKAKSADVLLKMTTISKEMWIAHMCSQS